MSTTSLRRTKLKVPVLVLIFMTAVVLMLVVNPAEAFAGEAKVAGSTLVYNASADEGNNLGVYLQGSDYWIFETNAALSVGSGCGISGAGTAVCNGAGITKILINVGPRNDAVYIDEASVSVTAEINGGSENDIIHGGAGNDGISGDAGNDELHGQSGNDHINGLKDSDTLYGDGGDDILNGGSGNFEDSIFLTLCPTDDDVLYGGAGSDTANYSDHGYISISTQNPNGTFVPLAVGLSLDDSANDGATDGCFTPATGFTPNIEHDNVRNDVEHLIGTKLDDTLIGDPTGADVLEGEDGNDTIDGRGGGDTLDGSTGDDTLKGRLVGCGGLICSLQPSATLNGGFGRDTADYSANTDPIDIDLTEGTATVGSYHADLSGIENATGGSGNDTLTGDGIWNVLKGGGGMDTLNGGAGIDDLYGDDGDDAINSRDGAAEQVSCGGGTDSVVDDNDDTLADCEVFIPKNVSPPQISGLAREGETLTVSDNGVWNGTPTNYAYRWQRCDTGAACTGISGATEQSYKLGTRDIGSTIRVAVTASNAAGSSQPVTSQMTSTVVPGDTTSPTVKSVTPPHLKRNVSPRTNVKATFSEAMDEISVENPGTFTLKKKGSTKAISATVTYSPATETVTLDPEVRRLRSGATYIARITIGAKDLTGNSLDGDPNATGLEDKVWSFKVSS